MMGPRNEPTMVWKATRMPMVRCPSMTRAPPTTTTVAVASEESRLGMLPTAISSAARR
ncbi:hypothetical protein D3C87_2173150 [compost metagenome]